MNRYIQIIKQLINKPSEEEWFEFKENWFEHRAIGEYISAISNAALLKSQPYGYFIWGINDDTHEITGTNINYQKDIKNEPFQHFIARQLFPDIAFEFHELDIDGKRVVLLEIPAASKAPTAFDGIRYIRIGSSKENIAKYPEREAKIFELLRIGRATITNTASEYQDLTFQKLFTYYAGKGISLKNETFKKNLCLLTLDGEYNIQAQLLSDNCHMPIRVSIFKGKNKAAPLYSIKEFGNTNLLIALDKVLEYGDVINLVQVDEENRIMERTDIALFNTEAFREAIINAFVHNYWLDGNAPMITIYSDRIEILSRGILAPNQTLEGFYLGESVPVNQQLSDIFLQLRISERSGRGVPKIVDIYGKSVFEFRENSIVITLPFKRITNNIASPKDTVTVQKNLSDAQAKILEAIKLHPDITQTQLASNLNLSSATIQRSISHLKKNGFIERIGSNKTGYWHVIE